MNNPVCKPKAPLSAYNLYFQVERKRILNGTDHLALRISHEELGMVAADHKAKDGKRPHRRTHGRIGFKELARVVARRWKALDRETKSLLEHHAQLQKREHKDLLEVYMKTEEYQLELQAQQLAKSLKANTYHHEGCSTAKLYQDDVKLFPAFHFQKTMALAQQGSNKEFDPKPQQGNWWMSSKKPKSHSSRQFSFLNKVGGRSEEYSGDWPSSDHAANEARNDEFVPSSVNSCEWDEVIHDQEDPEVGIHEHKEELLSGESDLVMMVYMVDFHSSMFPGTYCMSDLFDTSALNEIHQGEELFNMDVKTVDL